jgi:cysteine desulfurase
MIYLNSASTSQPAKEVIDDINFYLTKNWSNPSDISQNAIHAKGDVMYARGQIAKAIGATVDEIFFTSGGSESNNWAIKGILDMYSDIDAIITTKIEHPSVYNTCKYLETKGYKVYYVPVDYFGCVKTYELERTIINNRIKKPLVSIMFANNEIGSKNDIKNIADIIHQYNGILHTDAVQAFMHTRINVKELGIDLMSVSGHKFGCPKGIGFLYKTKDLDISPLIHGGKQEYGMRGGTENVPYICAMGNQVERLSEDLDAYLKSAVYIHNYIVKEVYERCSKYCEVYFNGNFKERIANNLSLTLKGINAEQLITLLDMKGICVSAGSACCAGSPTPSRVLKEIGLSDEDAFSTIRVSFDYNTTREMVDKFVDALVECIQSLQLFVD